MQANALRVISLARPFMVVLFLLAVLTSALAQQPGAYPPFTMTTRTTVYTAKGEAISVSSATRYDSANGDWRHVSNVGGYERATIYRRGRGVYTADARAGVTLKESAHAPGCPLRTAAQLLRDKDFIRIEKILGFEAYVLVKKFPGIEFRIETAFVPELGGGSPFKQVTIFDDGRQIVSEPIEVKLGEPTWADLRGPNFPVDENIPVFDKDLARKVISQPDPVLRPYVDAEEFVFRNSVDVGVVIDESGQVLTAEANTPVTAIRDIAIAAAYQASFSPTLCNGRPVKARGYLRYQIINPEIARRRPRA